MPTRAMSFADTRTRAVPKGKSGSKTQECDKRLLSAFPGENGSRRGVSCRANPNATDVLLHLISCHCAGRPPMYLEAAPFWCLLRINKRGDVFSMFANKGTKRRV